MASRAIYPYDDWFARETFVLFQGRDFKCKTSGMAQQIRTAAFNRGLKVRIEINENVITVAMRRLEDD